MKMFNTVLHVVDCSFTQHDNKMNRGINMTDENLGLTIGGIGIILSILGIWKLSELICKFMSLNLNFSFI